MLKRPPREPARYAKAPAIEEAFKRLEVEAKANDKVVRAIKKALKHLGLDAKRPTDWDHLRAIVLDSERKRKRGRKRQWSMEMLALLGMLVDALEAKHPEENDLQRAERLKDLCAKNAKGLRLHTALSLPSPDSLRKRFPEARRALRKWGRNPLEPG